MNKVQLEDVQNFAESFALTNDIANSTFLITGVTGLIGSTLAHCLLALNNGISIIAPVRNALKISELFSEKEQQYMNVFECDISNYDYENTFSVDYIIHCAAPTDSRFFVEHPVDTFSIICDGTSRLLEFAKKCSVKAMVNLSSLEVYGEILDDSITVNEDFQGYLNPMDVRSSYPMAKRAMESLCHLYARQYGVNVMVARLTQTTGAGISKTDNRIIAQFARLVSQGNDIILHTTGEAARPYCYTIDCVSAILYILLKGCSGEAYNVANEQTYISARGMADFLQANFNPSINVKIELKEGMGYAPTTKQRLSTEKLRSLGWAPVYGLKEIFERLIASLN